ncbi:hypothetical protein DPMN_190698 [Dreissena polymorpha]|uniref:Uncharacterized protein n=1 Tax=Dreissena polymorpha TaxID=45954 RepID=A0A9D3Y1S0_DREPO|nr:hypothetical protein DPMN_190698 [Dreissena polymorpha]
MNKYPLSLVVQIYWSENGELVCISTEESFFILKYRQEAVDQAKNDKELVTEDGIEEAFDVSTDCFAALSIGIKTHTNL